MDEKSPNKIINYAGKNLVFCSAIISFVLGVAITVVFINFNPKTVSNNDGNKNSQKSEDYEIPLEVELQALYNFSDIKAQLISLDEEIVKEAKDRTSKQGENLTDKDKDYYQKFTDPSFRHEKLKEVLVIDISNIKPEIKIEKDEIKKIIKAIYIFQVRFLSKDKFQKFADGQINQNTKDEIIRRVLVQDSNPETQSEKPSQTTKASSDAKIEEEYRLAVIKQTQRYVMNLYDQKCYENWQMLSDETQNAYNHDQLNYAKYCLHNGKGPDDKKNPVVNLGNLDKNKKVNLRVVISRVNNDQFETLKLCASSFNNWQKNKRIIKLDIIMEELCPEKQKSQ
jgi:hypothetical protein